MSQTAYKDALTSVGNKAAYNRELENLAQDIELKNVLFAIVMIDINNLKYINDTFGHEAGDKYIKGCCGIICKTYRHSPVFRIGGDEFVVVLKNRDYVKRFMLYTKIGMSFMQAYGKNSKKPWERYSASVGMAEYELGDESAEAVFKRADALMYENKMQFKAKHGSYR